MNDAGIVDTVSYAAATQNAHYIWFVFVGVGAVSAVALFFYARITQKIDRQRVPDTSVEMQENH